MISASSASRFPKTTMPHSMRSMHIILSAKFCGEMSPKPTVEKTVVTKYVLIQ